MVDAPSYKMDKTGDNGSGKGSSAQDTTIKLTNDNKHDVMALLNSKY